MLVTPGAIAWHVLGAYDIHTVCKGRTWDSRLLLAVF